MGHELRGDDAAGVAVARILRSCLPWSNGLSSHNSAVSVIARSAVCDEAIPSQREDCFAKSARNDGDNPRKASSSLWRQGLPLPESRITTLVIDAGPAVENCTGLLRRFGPDLVLLIDAAQMDEAPGAVRWLSWEETDGLSASTHTLPPRVLAQYLTSELGCEVALLGIQPADTTIGAPLSPTAQAAVQSVTQALAELLEDLALVK